MSFGQKGCEQRQKTPLSAWLSWYPQTEMSLKKKDSSYFSMIEIQTEKDKEALQMIYPRIRHQIQ